MNLSVRGSRFVRTLGIGLTLQALLSGANFAVGLILIRRTSDLQYSYYILATNALLLLTALQTSFVQPYIVSSLTALQGTARANLVGALIRTNKRWMPMLCGAGVAVTVCLWGLQQLVHEEALLVAICMLAAAAALSREFFRITLFAYRHPAAVLQADLAFVVILVVSAYLATLVTQSAVVALIGAGLANLAGYVLLHEALWKREPWNTTTTEHVMGRIAKAGTWAIVGSGIHWLLIQGYSYLVAGILNVGDVAAIAATRLTLVPVFVLSGGVSMLLFPMTSRWVHDLGTRAACRRLLALVGGLGLLAVIYIVTMWSVRDWIFAVVLKKQFLQRDSLLLLWSAVFLVTLCRDQLATLPAARGRFRDMTLMTGFSAAVWLLSSYLAIVRYGPPGAVLGILIGEVINMAGIVFLIFRDTRQPQVVPAV